MATLWTWDSSDRELWTPDADDGNEDVRLERPLLFTHTHYGTQPFVLAPDSWEEDQVRAFLKEKGILKDDEDSDG